MTSQSNGAVTTVAQSAVLIYNNGSADVAIPNRLFMVYGANYSDDTAATIQINLDFALSSTVQVSYSGTGTRAATDYCDVQLVNLATLGATSTSTTQGAFASDKKCTYIAKAAAGAGAPAFKITNLDWWKFQLHYAEWNSVDVSNTQWLPADNKYFGQYTATTYPNPV